MEQQLPIPANKSERIRKAAWSYLPYSVRQYNRLASLAFEAHHIKDYGPTIRHV